MPTCYRHPGRETYVRCTRCERPICPDCMVEASVGFQCPECVHQGNRDIRHAKGRFGGEVATVPRLTYALIAVNVVVFLLQYGLGDADLIRYDFGLIPPLVAEGEYYRLLTSAFLHNGVTHLALNMWALWAVGQSLELWLGRSRFLVLYGVSALGGSTLVYLASPYLSNTAGASGAIFGLFGAIFVISRRMNLDIRPIAVVIVLNLAFTFVIPLLGGANISWQGHVGGLVTGGLLAFAYAHAPRQNRTAVQFGAAGAITALLLVLIVLRTAAFT
ncbi:rhomboid family intramembrane serine protease [Actinocorallia libanotica]|uniref:Rhomboid family intramembrane serine protease n=1 Tax=Actinocorallia libanotica TaxID=46162 RepID=A0ABN1QDD8_9ACTN